MSILRSRPTPSLRASVDSSYFSRADLNSGHKNGRERKPQFKLPSGDLVSISLEVPVLLNLDEDLNYGVNVVPMDYSSYFVTPSARFTFFPNVPITPWASVGGGFGRFSESSDLLFGGANPGAKGSTTGIFQFGVGLDVRAWRSFSVRGEARDFYSGVPQLNLNTGKSRQSNLFVGLGLVWHFGR